MQLHLKCYNQLNMFIERKRLCEYVFLGEVDSLIYYIDLFVYTFTDSNYFFFYFIFFFFCDHFSLLNFIFLFLKSVGWFYCCESKETKQIVAAGYYYIIISTFKKKKHRINRQRENQQHQCIKCRMQSSLLIFLLLRK